MTTSNVTTTSTRFPNTMFPERITDSYFRQLEEDKDTLRELPFVQCLEEQMSMSNGDFADWWDDFFWKLDFPHTVSKYNFMFIPSGMVRRIKYYLEDHPTSFDLQKYEESDLPSYYLILYLKQYTRFSDKDISFLFDMIRIAPFGQYEFPEIFVKVFRDTPLYFEFRRNALETSADFYFQRKKAVQKRDDSVTFLAFTHAFRRRSSRLNIYYCFTPYFWHILFPNGFKRGQRQRSTDNCMYLCRFYRQSCVWHKFGHVMDAKIASLRCMFAEICQSFIWTRDFIASLYFNQQYVHRSNFDEIFYEEDTQVDYLLTVREKPFPYELYEDIIPRAQAAIICSECNTTFETSAAFEEHNNTQHQGQQNGVNFLTTILNKLHACADQLVLLIQENYQKAKNSRFGHFIVMAKRVLINVTLAFINMVLNPTWPSVLTNIGIVVNELYSVASEYSRPWVVRVNTNLIQVMKSFFVRAQAQPTREEDQQVANESFVSSFVAIICSMVPGVHVDAGLLKARMQKIENVSKCMTYTKSISEWLVKLYEKLSDWIQIYFFGHTQEELNEIRGLVANDQIENWITSVRNFEIDVSTLTSNPAQLNGDQDKQRKVVELKKEGERFMTILSRSDLRSAQNLSRLVEFHLRKVNNWYSTFEASLAARYDKDKPFMVYLYGAPGVGKTYMIDYIAQFLLASKGYRYNPARDKYQKPRTSTYWEGYNSQKVVVFDDFLQMKEDESNVSELASLIDIGSRNPMPLDMAGVESKGKHYFNSPLVFFTSNVEPSQQVIERHVVEFQAVLRRIDLFIAVDRTAPPKENVRFDVDNLYLRLGIAGNSMHPIQFITQPMQWSGFVNYMVDYYASISLREAEIANLPPLTEAQENYLRLRHQNVANARSQIRAFNNIIPHAQARSEGDLEEPVPSTSHPMAPCPSLDSIHDDPNFDPDYDYDSVLHIDCSFCCSKVFPFMSFSCPLCPTVVFERPYMFYSHIMDVMQGQDEESKTQHRSIYGEYSTYIPHDVSEQPPFTPKESNIVNLMIRSGFDAEIELPWSFHLLSSHHCFEVLHDLVKRYQYTNSYRATLTRFCGKIYDKVSYYPVLCYNKFAGPLSGIGTKVKNLCSAVLDEVLSILKALGKLVLIGLGLSSVVGLIHWMNEQRRAKVICESFGPSAPLMTTARQKKKILVEGAVEEEAVGPSGALTTVARKKKMPVVEADGSVMILKYSTAMPPYMHLQPYHPQIHFQPAKTADIDIMFVYMAKHKDSLEVEFVKTGKNFVFVTDKHYKDGTPHFMPREVGDFVYEHLEDGMTAEAEALKDRMDLVEDILDNRPHIEAARDPNMNMVMTASSPNAVIVKCLQTKMSLHGVFLTGTTLVFPAHVLKTLNMDEAIIRLLSPRYENLDFRLGDYHYTYIEEKDLIFVVLDGLVSPHKNLINKFIKNSDVERLQDFGYLHILSMEKPYNTYIWKQMIGVHPIERQTYVGDAHEERTVIGAVQYRGDSEVGDCGALMFQANPQAPRKIVGIHLAGAPTMGFSCILTQELLETYLRKLSVAQAAAELEFYDCLEVSEFFDIQLEDNKCEFKTALDPIGMLAPEHMPSRVVKSQIRFSPLYGEFGEPKSAPAPLRPVIRGDHLVDPLNVAMSKFEVPYICFEPRLIRRVVERMRIEYATLQLNDRSEVGLLTDDENINGSESNKWIHPINMKTSPGYPYVLAGGKEKYLIGEERRFMIPLLEKAVLRREELARQGVAPLTIMVDTLKDERLSLTKVEACKTRIFCNCPLDLNILIRRYFLRFLTHLMDYHLMWEVSVGINPHGEDWTLLYNRLYARGSHWLAGDYSAWDKRTPYQLAMALLPIVEDFYKRFGDYKKEHAVIRKSILQDCFCAVHLAIKGKKGCLYKVHQSMPSGIPLTAVWNSLINSLLFRLTYLLLGKEKGLSENKLLCDYSSHVAFVAYGDDHIARVSEVVFDWFNMVTLSTKLAEYGIGYTMPDKESRIQPEIADQDLVYLKRKFVPDLNKISMNAPLDLDHIIDILNWVQATGNCDIRTACASAVMCVFIELTHYPQSVFNKWYKIIVEACIKKGLQIQVATYDELLLRRKEMDLDPTLFEW